MVGFPFFFIHWGWNWWVLRLTMEGNGSTFCCKGDKAARAQGLKNSGGLDFSGDVRVEISDFHFAGQVTLGVCISGV